MYDFDKAATTQLYSEVIDVMVPWLIKCGNPSSVHNFGQTAAKALEESREIIAAAIGAKPEEIYFTSGGTEANNWAIKGLKNPYKFHPLHIVTSNIEHHSISEAIQSRWDMTEDIECSIVKANFNGLINPNALDDMFGLHTRLCSIMLINNELGTIQPTSLIGKKCRDNNVLYHCDAVQAFGHVPINVKKQYIDLLSASSHKLHGPRGIGFLYISNDSKSQYVPLVNGGQQENNMRAGTENVVAAVGFAKAVEISVDNMRSNTIKEELLFKSMLGGIYKIKDVHVHGSLTNNDHRHINVGFDGVKAEELIAILNEQQIYVSSGSACNSKSNSPSHVLKAIGLDDDEANSSIRISFDHSNSAKEVDEFIKMLQWDVELLRRRDGL